MVSALIESASAHGSPLLITVNPNVQDVSCDAGVLQSRGTRTHLLGAT